MKKTAFALSLLATFFLFLGCERDKEEELYQREYYYSNDTTGNDSIIISNDTILLQDSTRVLDTIIKIDTLVVDDIAKEPDPAVISGFTELSNYCNNISTSCGQELDKEGHRVIISGYIQPMNVFLESKRFVLFEHQREGSVNVDVHVGGSEAEILDKLNSAISGKSQTDLIPVELVGIIKGFDLPINEHCFKGIRLLVSKPEDFSY